eukprot:6171957-Pleurochrysis_carterae.AAC.2
METTSPSCCAARRAALRALTSGASGVAHERACTGASWADGVVEVGVSSFAHDGPLTSARGGGRAGHVVCWG